MMEVRTLKGNPPNVAASQMLRGRGMTQSGSRPGGMAANGDLPEGNHKNANN
jgi:hypothetical protein